MRSHGIIYAEKSAQIFSRPMRRLQKSAHISKICRKILQVEIMPKILCNTVLTFAESENILHITATAYERERIHSLPLSFLPEPNTFSHHQHFSSVCRYLQIFIYLQKCIMGTSMIILQNNSPEIRKSAKFRQKMINMHIYKCIYFCR